MDSDCTYCGLDIWDHDPVFVESANAGTRESVGQFCNYACLSAHIDEADLAAGASCTLDSEKI